MIRHNRSLCTCSIGMVYYRVEKAVKSIGQEQKEVVIGPAGSKAMGLGYMPGPVLNMRL